MKFKIKASINSAIILCFILGLLNESMALVDESNAVDEDNKTTYILQIEEKSKLLKDTLNEFGADSKEQVINIYSNGVKNRNGPMQYSVMSKKLKKEFEKSMDKDQNYAWVTGTSSPWVTEYRIMKIKKVTSKEYEATVVFFLETSSGPYKTSKTILTINNKNNKWCITDINNIE